MHGFRWGMDDIFFVCLLKPLTSEIKIDEKEITAAKWTEVRGQPHRNYNYYKCVPSMTILFPSLHPTLPFIA